MVRTAYSRLRSRGARRPRLDELAGRRAWAASASGSSRRSRAALRELGAAGGGVSVDPRDRARRALRRVAGAPSGGRASRAGRARQALVRRQRQGALHGSVRRVRGRRWPSTPHSAASTASTATTACCACCSSSTASATGAASARGRRSTSRTSSCSRATCWPSTRACASSTRSASRTCSWTSSRTPTRSRTSCSSCSTATTCSASATRTSRSTASATRDVERVPRPLDGGRRGRARREHHGQLPQPRRGAGGDRPLLQLDLAGRASSRSRRRPARAPRRRGCRPASSCS